jgi:acetoin utilization protein AcuB
MTPSPHSIGRDQTLAAAHKLMREHHIRHLPVLQAGKLVGIVTDRDLHLVETLQDVNPEVVLVDDAQTPDPYCVAPNALLTEVVATMAERKLGCAIVVDDERLVGIFTTIDALRALMKLLGRS